MTIKIKLRNGDVIDVFREFDDHYLAHSPLKGGYLIPILKEKVVEVYE